MNDLTEEKKCKEMTVYFHIDSERAVRDAFARYHVELGYPKILVSQESFPDYILEDGSGNRIRAEAEFRSSGYNHPLDGCDLVICWEADKKLPIQTLELCRYIELPQVFDGFQEGDLDSLSEYAKKYTVVANKSKDLLKELGGFIKRRNHSSICTHVYAISESYDEPIVATTYGLNYGREGWEVHPVLITINLLREELQIEGRLYSYLPKFRVISLEKWKELFQEAKDKGFISAFRQYSALGPYSASGPQEISIGTFVKSLPDPDKIWCVAFTKKYGINFLYQKPYSILKSLSATIVSLFDFLELSGLYGQQSLST